jgi:hypothetical protein
MVAAIDLNLDPQVKKDLQNLTVHQTNDPRIQGIKEKLTKEPQTSDSKYMFRNDILYCKDHKTYTYWRLSLPASSEASVIKFVHASLGHLESEKCIAQIANTFLVKNLGRKFQKLISYCDICQRVKHPNHSFQIESRSHLWSQPGNLCALDLCGQLPMGRGGVLTCFINTLSYISSERLPPDPA